MKWFCLLLLPLFSFSQSNDSVTMRFECNCKHLYTYLALGDSYTIGEGVMLHQNYPYQTVSLLRKLGYEFAAPEIIAKTGWTTDELDAGISNHNLSVKYDFVSLLIGVNNQYRGRNIIEYKEQFERLLKKSIELTNGKPERVVVVSIPDYSCTTVGKCMHPEKITKEIDEYNALNRAIAIQFKVQYVEVTESTRMAKSNTTLLAGDGLHPSAKEYAKWAKKLADVMKQGAKKQKATT